MPNYVNSYVSFERVNKAAKEKFLLLQMRITTENNFSDLMQDGKITQDETHILSWQHENVGPKWTTIDDVGDDYISMTSAWSSPDIGVQWLISELSKVDEKMITRYSYQEEQPDFAGRYLYVGDEMYDGNEDDWEDIVDLVEMKVEGLFELKDEDGELTEEWFDIFNENVYEVINDLDQEFFDDTLQSLYDAEKEEQ